VAFHTAGNDGVVEAPSTIGTDFHAQPPWLFPVNFSLPNRAVTPRAGEIPAIQATTPPDLKTTRSMLCKFDQKYFKLQVWKLRREVPVKLVVHNYYF
jgi:hypothetical protein